MIISAPALATSGGDGICSGMAPITRPDGKPQASGVADHTSENKDPS